MIDHPHASVDGRPADGRGGWGADAPAMSRRGAPSATPAIPLRIGQLLCSKLCHDLAGPVGAVTAGLDFLAETTGVDADAADVLTLSARQLARRLAFFRLAFGFAGGSGHLGWSEARRVSLAYFAESRIDLVWPEIAAPGGEHAAEAPADVVRCALCAVLIAAEGLVRGGTIEVDVTGMPSGGHIVVATRGRGATLDAAALDALADRDPSAVTARSATASYLGHLTAALGGAIEIDVSAADRVSLRLSFDSARVAASAA